MSKRWTRLTIGLVMKMTECYENHIYGRSTRVSKEEGIRDRFDLFIFTCGWESRCMEITKYDAGNFSFDSAAIISFKLGDENGYSQEHMDKLNSFADTKIVGSEIVFIEGEPNELEKITGYIRDMIKKLVGKLERPLHIGFDITSCPRYFFLYLLGFCLKYNVAKKLSFFYSEGAYKIDTKDYVLTKGDWKLTEISELEGSYNPADKKLFVVSAGFEGSRYRSLVAKYEPDDIGILLPDPGFNPDYTQKAKDECQPMIEEFNIPDDAIVKAPAGDAIATWNALKEPSLNKKDYHINYLTFGPKPHALAMGVHGFLNKKISVTYRIPEGYTKLEVAPTGIFWRYDIQNLIFL